MRYVLSELRARVSERSNPARWMLTRFVASASAMVPDGARVLDAGAGECIYKPLFAHTRYVAVDLCVGQPDWDYSRLDVVADLYALPFPSGVFEAVLSTQVLEHMREPERAVREYSRVLREGGQLFLTAPQGWQEHQQPHDYFRFTRFSLRWLLERAGFEVLGIWPQGGYFLFIGHHLRRAYGFLFPDDVGFVRGVLEWPVRFVVRQLLLKGVPICCYALDRLDRRKETTLGYCCYGRKRGQTRS